MKADMPMFHDVPQLVESPQMIELVGIPSMVRLKRLHYGDCLIGDPICLPSKLELCFKRVLLDNGETNIPKGFICSQQCQLPSEIIQRGSHAGDRVPEHQSAFGRGPEDCNGNNVLLGLKIVFGRNSLGIRFNEGFADRFKTIQVFLRPTHFQIGIKQSSIVGHLQILAS